MGMNELRKKHRAELDEMCLAIQPDKNCEIASRAIEIAKFWITKAENQAVQIKNLEKRNERIPFENTKCNDCYFLNEFNRSDDEYDW